MNSGGRSTFPSRFSATWLWVAVCLSAVVVAATPAADGQTISTGAVPIAIVSNPVTNKIYVSNNGSANVTVIDGQTGATSSVAVGNSPRDIAVNTFSNKIYVANYGANSLTVIDGASNGTTTVSLGENAFPRAVAVNAVTNRIYVANSGNGTVAVIDGGTNASVSVAAGTNPVAVAVNPVSNKVFVVNQGSNTVTIIDGATNAATTVAVGTTPSAVAVNSATNTAFVSNYGSNTISVIDGNRNSVALHLSVGTGPRALAVNPVSNKVYVGNETSSNMNVVDGASWNVTTLGVALSLPSAVGVNSVTNQIYVANGNSSGVTVIDGTDGTSTSMATGSAPSALAINPATNTIYVANKNDNDVTALDGSLRSATNVPAGTQPSGIAVNPVTHKAYISNAYGNSVTIVDAAGNAKTVATGPSPYGIGVNPITNKVYVATQYEVFTVIDGATDVATTYPLGTNVYSSTVFVNPVTNKIYFGTGSNNSVIIVDGATNAVSSVVPISSFVAGITGNPAANKVYVSHNSATNIFSVLDGATNAVTDVFVGYVGAAGLAINPISNTVYITNPNANTVTIVDAATNALTGTVAVGNYPGAVAVNPFTNKIYVLNGNDSTMTVIDGATKATTLVNLGGYPNVVPQTLLVDAVENRIYVSDEYRHRITVVDGATNAMTILPISGTYPESLGFDPITRRLLAANRGSADITIVNEPPPKTIPLSVTITKLANDTTFVAQPVFSYTATNSFGSPAPAQKVFYAVDTWAGPWNAATSQGNGNFTGQVPALLAGTHILYAYAVTGEDSTSTNTGVQSSPLIGNISAYVFLYKPAGPVFGYLDTAHDLLGRENSVAQQGTLTVSGWAADARDGAPVNHVDVLWDGVVAGQATLGLSRPDVMAYPSSGWSFSMPAGSASAGSHSLVAIAYDLAGASATLGARTITVQANTAPSGWMDTAANNVNGTSTIAQFGTLYAAGWAADQEDGAPVAKVELRIDGVAIGNATLGASRPDVVGYPNSGWSFVYNIGALSAGLHAVTAVAYDSFGVSTLLSPSYAITVVSNTPPYGWMDLAVNAADGTSTIPQTGNLLVSGWAVDPQDGAPVAKVKVLIDGSVAGEATLGQSRPDITNYPNSGWSFTTKASALSAAAHSVSVVAYDTAGGSALLSGGPRVIVVSANSAPFGWLDVAANSADGSQTILHDGTLVVSGWAADHEDGAPIGRVEIRIDGVAVGNATLGLSRPDVTNYPNSGWSFTGKVASLSVGSHAVTAVAYDSTNASSVLGGGPRTIIVSSNTAPFGWMDAAVNAANGSSTVPQTGNILVSGWAADQQDGAPVSRVEVRIDGVAVGNATLGLIRPDVTSYPSSGWSFQYPASGLSAGIHSITAVAYDSANATTTLGGGPLAITVTAVVNTPPFGWIDAATNTVDGTSVVPQWQTVSVRGWAADNEDRAPVSKVEIRIDGVVAGTATLNLSRPDVANYPQSGWVLTYNIGSLAPGAHTVTAKAYDSGGASTTLSPALQINVTAAAAPKILFTAQLSLGGYTDLYAINSDGSGQAQLTHFPADSYQPSWSPDRKKIAFAQDGAGAGLYIMNADGSGATLVPTPVNNVQYPAWSPDGSKLAFVFLDTSAQTTAVSVMNPDGSGVKQLSPSYPCSSRCDFPERITWSPDGLRLAYSTSAGITTMNSADGSAAVTFAGGMRPAWSPDGAKIAYVAPSAADSSLNAIWVMARDGSGAVQVTHPTSANTCGIDPSNSSMYGPDRDPAWSPDGSRLVYASFRIPGSCASGQELYTSNADGTGEQQVTHNGAPSIFAAWR